MFLSAVKVGVALLAVSGSEQQLEPKEIEAWKKIQPSVVAITQLGNPVGAAVLIDPSGLFIAHKSAVGLPPLIGRTANGTTIQLQQLASDEITQLVLLKAALWNINPGQRSTDVNTMDTHKVQATEPKSSLTLLAALPSGPMRVALVDADRIGVMSNAAGRRVMKLTELQFEATDVPIGGAPLFNLKGELVGFMGATLETSPDVVQNRSVAYDAGFGGGGAASGAMKKGLRGEAQGPAALMVAYSVSPEILNRVIEGFLSPDRRVKHPALGILCQDAQGAGAVVVRVMAGSTAAAGGLEEGDIITHLNDSPVKNQFDYARFMLDQRVGDTLKVTVNRGGKEVRLNVKIGY